VESSIVNLSVAVCGGGAFGRNHIRVYRALGAEAGVHLAAVVEPDEARARLLEAELLAPDEQKQGAASPVRPARFFSDVESMLAAVERGELRVDAASVCVPTSAHCVVASLLLAAGVHVLVEKPIAATLEEADQLIGLAAKHERVLQVGHLERFNPAVLALAPLLRGPMFFEAHRLSIFLPRSLDVDVVLDLMIHDLDIVLTLAQSPVEEVRAVGLPILSAKTDIANVRVQFASGCVANFTASRVSTERVRKLRFFQPHQYISVDYARQDLLVIEVQPAGAGEELPALSMEKPVVTPGEPLRLEIEAFVRSIAEGSEAAVTGGQGREALALALAIQEAIAEHAARPPAVGPVRRFTPGVHG
jgi:predicted dehydrogenase